MTSIQRFPFIPLLLACLSANVPATAQFKTVGPAPYSPAVAHTNIKNLLAKIDSTNQQQTIDKISALLVWFRDAADEELIAAWKRDQGRENLPEAITQLADARVAAAVVDFSWHERREATFKLAYAPMLGNLMLRFPDSAKPLLDDLLIDPASGQAMPILNESEQYAVCRILLDMPARAGTWEKTGLQILPRYREAAETLLDADQREGDSDKRNRAAFWIAALRPPVVSTSQPGQRTILTPPKPAKGDDANGARSGTLECSGDPIPPNDEYTFYNVPMENRRFEYDRKVWDVRLEPGQGATRNFILKNKSSKAQKNCSIRWSVLQQQ